VKNRAENSPEVFVARRIGVENFGWGRGTVICRYQVHAGSPRAVERVEVQFNPETIGWGAPATEFEEIAELPSQ
jgi:hypothetical protein